jgi:hypothetical protein
MTAKPRKLGHVGVSGPHHTSEWHANDGPGIKPEGWDKEGK